jgi:cytochrome c oxidase assembly factor CtaG
VTNYFFLLHGGGRVAWDTWALDPSLIAGLFIAVAGYFYAVAKLRPVEEAVEGWRVAAWYSGVALIFLALASPLDIGADQLLSLHMLQHVLLGSIGPPLLLLGLPARLLRKALRRGPLLTAARVATQPLTAAIAFSLNMWLWHAPPVYALALDHLPVHIFQHILFLATGIAYWWPVVSPLPELGRIGAGARLLYLFVTGFPMGILALLLLSAGSVVYDFYAVGPRLWGVDPLTDQQLAGVVMGGLGEITSFIAFSLLFWRYLDDAETEIETAPRPASSTRPSR